MEGVFIMNKKWDIEIIKQFVAAESECKLISERYEGYTKKLKFECSCGNVFETNIASFKSKNQRRCQSCSRKQPQKDFNTFKKEVYDLVGDEYEFQEYNGANTKTSVIHNVCGNSYSVTPSKFITTGRRCPHCNGGTFLGEKSINKRLKTLYDDEILLVDGFNGMREPAKFFNTISEVEFTALPTNVLQGYSLGRKISNGEFAIKTWLESKGIYFEYQFTVEKLKRKPFDFYIPDKNILIEYDGEQHFKPVKFFGGKDKYAKQQKTDAVKTKYCENNQIKLVRIPYWQLEEINTILKDAIL